MTDGTPIAAGYLAGYTIYYGVQPNAYGTSITITNPALTIYEVDGLTLTDTWCFAMSADAIDGSESALTNPVCGQPTASASP